MVLRKLAVVAAVCMLSGCGVSTAHRAATNPAATAPPATRLASAATTDPPDVPSTGGRGYSAALSARLLTNDSAPAGFTVQIATTMSTDAGDQRPSASTPCSDSMMPLLSGTRLTGTPSEMAAATLSNDAAAADFWVGKEVLRTYAGNGDGAQQAIADLRTFIGRCPTATPADHGVGDFRYAVIPGPHLGDDSIHVNCIMVASSGNLDCSSIIVRIGSALVAVMEQGNETNGDVYLNQVTEAAIRRFQATAS